MSKELVFLHLSDIHFNGRGLVDIYELDVTLRNELERDAQRVAKTLGHVNGVLVTGDLAYHATIEQFDMAFTWLANLCGLLGCPEENVWTVPGNHDVLRSAIAGSEILQDLHRAIRAAAPDRHDDAIRRYLDKDKEAGPLLFRPLENYNNRIGGKFGCAINPERPFWTDDLQLNDGSTLRLCGLNSALVSDALDDAEKLVLGSVHSERALLREDGVEYLVLCHHPPEWLLDHDAVDQSFTALARLQIFGHKHAFRLVAIGDTLRISAGAVHPNRREPRWEPRYSFLCISVTCGVKGRTLSVVVHPRIWNNGDKAFQADFDAEGHDNRPFDLPIPTFERASPVMITAQPTVGVAEIVTGEKVMPPSADQKNVINPARRLVYRFLSLPYRLQIAIAQQLNLLRDDDADLAPNVICHLVCQRARDGAQLEELWNAIEAAHGVNQVEANPFAGK